MSFILDALKKSESDRQRQSGPALYEVKVAAPRSPLPYWAIGLIVLLGVNLVIVAWALLRRPAHGDNPPATTAATAPLAVPAAAPVAYSPPPNAPAAQGAYAPANPSGAAGSYAPGSNPNAQAAYAPQPAYPPQPPYATQPPPVPQTPAPQQAGGLPPPGAQAASAPAQPPGSTGALPPGAAGADGGPNPDDYAPATEPSRTPPGFGFHVKRSTGEGIPLYSQVSGAGVPELKLDLWAYDPNPQNRFVLINMKRAREGDTLAEGVKVESITPDGVILSHNGSRFLLPRE